MNIDVAPTRIIGVLNVTPNSFSDGGTYLDPDAAIAHARAMIAAGAQIIDVGGESTRPGADRVTPEEEQQRVLPVIRALADEGITVSVDTVNAETARLAVASGASIINDVSGGTADPKMRGVAAESGAHFVVMHWRGIPDPGHARSIYTDVVTEVCDELAALADAAIAAGVSADKIILDPGLGFDKTAEQGWQLLHGLDRLSALGYPLLIGISRKRMLGETLRAAHADLDQHARDRDVATAVVSALCAQTGAWGVRVHDVAATATALAVAHAWSAAPVTKAAVHGTPTSTETPADTDRITLTGLEVFAHHGVFDFEREQGQRFLIDVEASLDLRPAAAGDDLGRTLNYAQLADAILVSAADDPVDLIETLAERLATVALSFDGVNQVRITVHKPDAPIDAQFTDVSVSIVRRRGQQR